MRFSTVGSVCSIETRVIWASRESFIFLEGKDIASFAVSYRAF